MNHRQTQEAALQGQMGPILRSLRKMRRSLGKETIHRMIEGRDAVEQSFSKEEVEAIISMHLELEKSKTRIVEQEKALALANQRLERAWQEQKELLHILCHDLSNPLGSIRTLTKLLGAEPCSQEKLPEYLGWILDSANHGLEVIDLVREMRALDEFELTLSSVDLKDCLLQSVSMFTARLQAKELKVNLEVPTGLMVVAEKTSLINSVVNNLLANAIKFSYPKSHIRMAATSSGRGVTLLIEDKGIGMPQAMLQDLFRIDAKTSRPGTLQEPGTGFGMPLAMKFMKAYGGEIRLESKDEAEFEKEHGTRVYLSFQRGE